MKWLLNITLKHLVPFYTQTYVFSTSNSSCLSSSTVHTQTSQGWHHPIYGLSGPALPLFLVLNSLPDPQSAANVPRQDWKSEHFLWLFVNAGRIWGVPKKGGLFFFRFALQPMGKTSKWENVTKEDWRIFYHKQKRENCYSGESLLRRPSVQTTCSGQCCCTVVCTLVRLGMGQHRHGLKRGDTGCWCHRMVT